MSRSEHHSREVVEADRAELIRKLREPIDHGAGIFGEDGYRPPMQAEACGSCGSELYGGELPICPVCGMATPWRQEFGRILDFERRHATWRPSDRATQIRETFAISPTAYELRVARMLEDPRALTVDAITVRRLQRRRDAFLRGGHPIASTSRPMPRQRPLDFPSRPGTTSPASVPTSTPLPALGAEGTAESSATESLPDRGLDDVAAAGDTFFPTPGSGMAEGPALPGSDDAAGRRHGSGALDPTLSASAAGSGETSEGVRRRVENDRVWGRRDRLQRRPRPLGGSSLLILLRFARDLARALWRSR